MKVVILHQNSHTIVDQDYTQVPLERLKDLEDSSCDVLNLADAMDYVDMKSRDTLLMLAAKKLRKDGEIFISGTDSLALMNNYQNHLIGIEQMNTSLYAGRLSIGNLWLLQKRVKAMQSLSIVNSKLDGVYFSLRCKRNNEIF